MKSVVRPAALNGKWTMATPENSKAENSKANRRSSQLQPTTLVCMLRPTKPRKPAR